MCFVDCSDYFMWLRTTMAKKETSSSLRQRRVNGAKCNTSSQNILFLYFMINLAYDYVIFSIIVFEYRFCFHILCIKKSELSLKYEQLFKT